MKIIERQRLTLAAGALVAFAACGDGTGPTGERALQVTVQVVGDMSAVLAGHLHASQSGGGGGTAVDAVEIDGAAFALGGLKLETAGLDETVDWVFDESVVVPLDFSGTPVLAFDTDVPPGTYKELEISIDKLEVGNPAEEPLIDQWPMLADASVVIEGTVTRDGGGSEQFTFVAPLDIDLELLFDAPVEFTAENNPVTVVSLTIDVSRWFMEGGVMLDPTDPDNRSAVEGSIQASLELNGRD